MGQLVIARDVPDAPAPHLAHQALCRHAARSFLLESGEQEQELGRYSILGVDPAGLIRVRGNQIRVSEGLPAPPRDQSPVEYLRRLQSFYHVGHTDLPFVGGLVGIAHWNWIHDLEPTLGKHDGESIILGLYLDAFVYDHKKGTCTYISRGEDRLDELLPRLQQPETPGVPVLGEVQLEQSDKEFEAVVQRLQEQILAGEAFQIVASREWTIPIEGTLEQLYAWLREHAPVPYQFHVRFDEREWAGASPEMLVRVRQGTATTFPIAGTRRRGTATDAALSSDLLGDRKELAEHAMLIDLARNDLSRACTPGSVQVPKAMEPKLFRDVIHLVSQVEGTLAPGKDAWDALAGCFPAGTVSGAPKLRAIEHLERVESTARNAYAGAVLYASFDGNLDSAILIRTAVRDGNNLSVRAGAGVTHLSDPAAEAQETRSKVATIFAGLGVEP